MRVIVGKNELEDNIACMRGHPQFNYPTGAKQENIWTDFVLYLLKLFLTM